MINYQNLVYVTISSFLVNRKGSSVFYAETYFIGVCEL